jgi:uncharacterized protein (DUF1919 family)
MQQQKGFRIPRAYEILGGGWDYLIVSFAGEAFHGIRKSLEQLGIAKERILTMAIFSIPGFDFSEYIRIVGAHLSIISNHCWGGMTYHMLRTEFLSPTINLFFEDEEYLKMLENLHFYFSLDQIDYCGWEYDENMKINWPVGSINDVKIHFNHYTSFEDAINKWNIRKQRVNWDNLFVQMTTDSREYAERFDRLPYPNKVVFVPFESDLKSAINIDYISKMIDMDTLGTVITMVSDIESYYPLKLLAGKKDCMRLVE